ncbi:alpha/beta hydrolase [Pseudomonas sp. S75]|uniref:alpha/beta fold hydrolase n=1 Tax=unclassified Pseudomonas TaxID=196821 RepID=UPI001904743F|nr:MULTISPECIES: alpha/beta hydrolase [unclassified Pseudomonas]MBJ9977126.1 alpha/beta hydrolase [Pseudomonas sp. S30]MBK0154128.1 alpha/beta hydrolase [Pseudomonas sp. S75]
MPAQPFWFTSSHAHRLHVHRWLPTAPPRALVLLVHGMAEHGGRYERLGQALSEAGMGVVAPDLRGHGLTARADRLGLLAEGEGWRTMIDELARLAQHLGEQFPGTPLVLFGHSMGSYLAQGYLLHHSANVRGAVLSGSTCRRPGVYRAARLIARLESWRQGPQGRSALIDWLSFGTFNNAFAPTRTAFDWLSRDPREVDTYVADPLCGFRCCSQLWLDLLLGLVQISQPGQLARIDANLPMLVIGGECDPVSAGGRLTHLAQALRATGHGRVHLRVYPDARHELLNELNRDEVIRDIIAWLERTLALGRPTDE